MDGRERFCTVLDGGVPDRVPFQDTYWQSTLTRWQQEGLAADVDPLCAFWLRNGAAGRRLLAAF